MNHLSIQALDKFPLINPGDNLCSIIIDSINGNEIIIDDGDVILIAQKIVSKSENRFKNLLEINPSEKAIKLGKSLGRDPSFMQQAVGAGLLGVGTYSALGGGLTGSAAMAFVIVSFSKIFIIILYFLADFKIQNSTNYLCNLIHRYFSFKKSFAVFKSSKAHFFPCFFCSATQVRQHHKIRC